MAVGHHLGERSYAIEQSHNLLSGRRAERQDFVNLEEGGSECMGLGPGWRFGCGTGEGSRSGTRGSGVGVCVGKLVPINTSAIFWSSQVGCGKECSV